MSHGHACFECGASAAFGFRLPGSRGQLPEGKRGYLWACAAHRDLAEDRRERAVQPVVAFDVAPPAQRGLFDRGA